MELIRKYKQGKLTTADVRTINNAVVCLMILVTVSSIIWSVSIHMLSGDFSHGFIGAKLAFRERDLTQLDARSKRILQQDLEKLINETYANVENATDASEIPQIAHRLAEAEEGQTIRKIPPLFQISNKQNVPDHNDDQPEVANTTLVPKVKFNAELDRNFLTNMTVDVYRTRWRQNAAVQFIYSFPFLSEIVAIIWTAMCLIFQAGVKKVWGLPKPWRIVLPSILIFSLMTLGTLIYTFVANRYLKAFCNELRAELTDPQAISCGQAISVLRPVIRQHEFKHDVYLNLFRVSYILTLVLWTLALLVMVLRYSLAIDFQLVDVKCLFDTGSPKIKADVIKPEFTEVLLDSPKHQHKLLKVDECQKSEDDFQSAKSQFSEVATPLLEQQQQQRRIV